MNLLIDTQAFLWFAAGDARLPRSARRLIESGDSSLYMSLAGLWEIAIEHSLGKIDLEDGLDSFLQDRFEEGFQTLPVEVKHILRVALLPFYHRDPFDRLMIAQAVVEDFTIVTGDLEFRKYEVRVQW